MGAPNSQLSGGSLAVGGLIAMASAVGIGRFIYTPILPPMVEALGLSKGQAGLIASANFAGYLAGAVAAASPRVPGTQRSVLLAALLVSAVTTAGMAAADTMALAMALRFVGGLASAFALVFASALVLERLAAVGRSDLAAVHFAGVGTGIFVSAALVAMIGTDPGQWRAMWLGGGALTLLGLVLVAVLLPAAEPAVAEVTASASMVKWRMTRLILAYGLFGFGYVITATFLIAMVRGSVETVAYEPLMWMAFGLAAAPSVAIWVAVSKQTGTLGAFAIACLAEAIGVLSGVLWPTPAGLALSAVLVGGTFMGITALGLMAGRQIGADAPRRAVALLTAAFSLGQIVGPAVAGYGYDLTGSFFVGSLAAAGALLMASGLALSMQHRPKV